MRRTRAQFTLSQLMLAVTIAATVFAIFITTIRSSRLATERESREGACSSSLNNIAIAPHNYIEENGRFPPPFEADEHGDRKHSWRPLILRFFPLDYPQTDRYDLGDRWDGIKNRILSSEVPGFLQCPSQRDENPHGSPFVMINDFSDRDIDNIPGNAILVLEVWGANQNWLDPHDRVETSPQIGIRATDHPNGFGVILRDFSRVRVRDVSRIRKSGSYYVVDR